VVAVFDKRIEAPSWTPDGSTLLFKEGRHVEKISAAGGKIETAAGSPALSKADGEQPSPDGQRVAFWSEDAEATTLNVKTVSDGTTKMLAKLFEGARPQSAPSWSPDGKRLVFVSYQLVP
jgi:Tol biopolymer transport system component